MKPKESTYQVVLDALALSTCYPAFLITAEVPVIYMHQFWATVDKHKASYRFKIDNKKFSVKVEVFRDILNIATQLKEVTKRSKKDFHISQASGSGDGSDFESGVLDEQQRKTSGVDEGTDSDDDESNDDNSDEVTKDDDEDDVESDANDDKEASDSEKTYSDEEENPNLNLNDDHEHSGLFHCSYNTKNLPFPNLTQFVEHAE
ncbi:hypothetical protein Tco_1427405 [Tanacetum coccineum]